MTVGIWFVASPLSMIILAIIELYQRCLSPYKGFRCAYRVARGRHSCSEFGKRALRRGGVLGFWPLLRRRFARCAAAAKLLKARKAAVISEHHLKDKPEEDSRRRSKASWADCITPDCGGADCSALADIATAADPSSCAADGCDVDMCSGIG